MTAVEKAGEVLVRRLDRSNFLRRSAMAAFGFTAAAAAQGLFPSRALANSCQAQSGYCVCHAPGINGYWCSNIGGNCVNGNCDTRYCSYNFDTWTTTACWCTLTCQYDCHTPTNYEGYYHCCDCNCPSGPNGTLCGCKYFIYTCMDPGLALHPDSPEVYKCC